MWLMRIAWTALGAIVVGMLIGAGCADECASNGDCSSSQRCSAGKCVTVSRPPPGPFSDAQPRDAEPAESGVHADAMAADADAGPTDATVNDDGGPDAGADGGDAGTVPTGVERVGLIHVEEITTSTGTTLGIYGHFIAYGAAAVRTSFPGRDGPCTLIDRTLTRGLGTGFPGSTVTVSGFRAGLTPPTIVLTDARDVGIFIRADGDTMGSTFWAQDFLTHTIGAGSGIGDITAATTSLSSDIPNPPTLALPPPGMAISLRTTDVDFRWTPEMSAGIAVAAELRDASGQVLLRCEGPNGGQLQIPTAARLAFVAAGTSPFRIVLHYERSTQLQVPVIGGAAIPTTIRHRSGYGYVGL